MKAIAAVMLALPLMLTACGDNDDDTSEATGGPTGSREILEGTIDDSMIDLTEIDTKIVPDESGAAEGTDQPAPASKPAAKSADESESDAPADSNDEAETDSTGDSEDGE